VLSALTIGIPAFFLSLAPNNRRYVPGFLRRVLGFALLTGIVIAVLIFASYFTSTSLGSSSQLASTVAASVVMVIGAWVLFCLARPVNYWKTLLIVTLGAVFVGLLAIPSAREFLNLAVQLRAMLLVLAFGPLGIICVEAFWRRDQRMHAVDPRVVVGDRTWNAR
jgi:cation-transporting ATPase E